MNHQFQPELENARRREAQMLEDVFQMVLLCTNSIPLYVFCCSYSTYIMPASPFKAGAR